MTTAYRPTKGIHVRIEQAIARGDTLDVICETLNVEPALVDKVMRHMDAALVEDAPDPVPRRQWSGVQPCGTPAAYARHLSRREPVDSACREAYRLYARDVKRARRARERRAA